MGSNTSGDDSAAMTSFAPTVNDLKVLVVDDESVVLENLCDGLTILGFDVCRANSTCMALTILRNEPRIGVVITDVRMPGADGLHLAHEILTSRTLTEPVQVILMTGHASIEDVTAGLRAGVSDLLRKPFRLAEVSDAITKAIAKASEQRRVSLETIAREQRLTELEEGRDALTQQLNDLMARLATFGSGADGAGQDDCRALSHALRTPLNAIAGGAAMVSDAVNTLLIPGIGYIQEGLAKAISAVELVEEFCRLDAGAHEDYVAEVDVAELVRAKLLAMPDMRGGLRISTEVNGSTDTAVVASKVRVVDLVLSHCIRCAFDGAPQGSSLTASVSAIVEGGRRWVTIIILVSTANAEVALPDGCFLPTAGDRLTRTQEDLHFAIARRLLLKIGGRLGSWSEPGQAVALRIALPG